MAAVRDNIRAMGAVLGHPDRAEAVVAAFDVRLAALTATSTAAPAAAGPGSVASAAPTSSAPPRRPLIAAYGANSYASGRRTLEGQVIDTAGFDNVATRHGLDWGGTLPLELLVMDRPETVLVSRGPAGPARANEVLGHPALAGIAASAVVDGPDWTCATPAVLDALAALADLRKTLAP